MHRFEQELAELKRRVVAMGELAESMVEWAVAALGDPQSDIYRQVLTAEEQVDQMQLDIDREVIRLLTIYGPVATDLRFVLMVSRITMEIERIGDQAVNMCEDLQLMVSKTGAKMPPEIHKMARLVEGMVRDALLAFQQRDTRLAVEVVATDDLVDALNDQVVRELLSEKMMRQAIGGPSDVAEALALILIARSLERIADQATNIGEEVVYLVKGDDIRHQPARKVELK